MKDEQGKIIWKNFFKIDVVSILMIIAIVLMTFGYVHDTKECMKIIESPCEFCKESNCCNIINAPSYTLIQPEGNELNFTITK